MKTRVLRTAILCLLILLAVPWLTKGIHSSGTTGTVCVEHPGTTGCPPPLPFVGAPLSWSNPSLNPSPAVRTSASMVYDSASTDRYVFLFGGYAGGTNYLGDTWKFSSGIWTQLSISGPSARADSAMVYDAADGYVLLFGGYNAPGLLGDTWKFFAGTWTKLLPSLSPSARSGASAADDPASADGYVVLFGGWTGGTNYLGDTWTFSAGSWTQLSASSSPFPRAYAAMAYDYGDAVVVLFGGYNTGNFLGDTWAFTDDYWMNLPNSTPPQRSYSSITYDQADGYVLLFGGMFKSGGYLNDTWELPPSTLTVAVNISGSDLFNAFDIILLASRAVLLPASVDITGIVLAYPTSPPPKTECIGGQDECPNTLWDTPSAIELVMAPTSYCGLTQNCNGLLFTANYFVVGAGAITIGFQTGCIQSSNPGTCVTVANGRNDPPENFAGATFNDLSSTSAALFTSTGMSIPNGGNVPTGTSVYDTARVAVSSISPTGTVTYAFFSNDACSGAGSPQTVTMSGGLAPNSTTQMSLGPGNYGFLASYSGDRNYNASRSLCESFMVPGPAVGGTIVPIDKLMLLAPFIGLGLLTSVGIWAAVIFKRSRTRRSAT